jgi:hypothetical protein
MSITIHQSPSGYASAHSELWHVVESTNKAVSGFQYVFDIYKAGNLVTRVKNSPYGSNKVGVLDVHNIVRASLSTNDFPQIDIDEFNTPVELGSDVFFTDYDVRYGEVSGGVTTANISSGTYKAYNNYPRTQWDRKSSDISGNVFLTNRPNIKWYAGEPVVLTVNIDSGSGSNEFDFVITRTGTSNYVDKSYANTEKVFLFGFVPPEAAKDVSLFSTASGFTSVLNFEKKCAKYDTHTLVFLNAFGGYDSFTFVHGKLTKDTEKKSFEQLKWKLSSNNMVEKIGNVYNESKKVYAAEYTEKMQLTSDILSTGEYDWLAELVSSPQVYYYSTENAEFYPVVITDTNYEFKDDRINKTDFLTLNIEFSDKTNTQFR